MALEEPGAGAPNSGDMGMVNGKGCAVVFGMLSPAIAAAVDAAVGKDERDAVAACGGEEATVTAGCLAAG